MPIKDAILGVVDSAKDFLTDNNPLADDAIDMLKADHRRVEELFKEILSDKSSTLTGQRKNIAAVLAELKLHAKVEESIVYPAVYAKTKRDSDDRLEVLEAFEEHGSMKDLMKKIERSSGRDETLKAKVQVLSEITEHHVKEEESTFFPAARKLLGEARLREIRAQIVRVKARPSKSPTQSTTRGKAPATIRARNKAGAGRGKG